MEADVKTFLPIIQTTPHTNTVKPSVVIYPSNLSEYTIVTRKGPFGYILYMYIHRLKCKQRILLHVHTHT